ncbi:hypothetical protein DICVIV_00132 [Dictyocaulus viviparus]|uniref:Uncharacterized protein n=1 Tax=Dictyocaulus viviparus TaxID=29172 RepID=A0A0D8YA71_DICVI|nr:hypothetical protein DICVIV_00132 [Dictyocaulus viviparus]
MVASSSKRQVPSAIEVNKSHLNFKPKIIVKEKERIARLKAAREAYSCDPNPAQAFVFEPMSSSLDMIRNNRIKMPTTRRVSSVAGVRCMQPRLSLLPLGINVFDSKVSASDQQKVREFISSRLTTGTTPNKSALSPIASHKTAQQHSSRPSRSVRFCVETVIEEQRESGGDEVLMNQEPSTSTSSISGKERYGCFSGEKAKKLQSYFRSPTSSRSNILQLSSPKSHEKNIDSVKRKVGCVNEPQSSAFVQSYTQLSNMTEEEWESVDPIMIDDLIDCLKERKERIRGKVCLMPADSMESLRSLPGNEPYHRKEIGFRRVSRKRLSNTDLQANQEVMLINQYAKGNRACRRSLRLRQKDPVSSTLGGDSPFAPIQWQSAS